MIPYRTPKLPVTQSFFFHLRPQHVLPPSLNPLLRRRRRLDRNISTTPLSLNPAKRNPFKPVGSNTAPLPSPATKSTPSTPLPSAQPASPSHRPTPSTLTRYALPALTVLVALDFFFTNIFQLMTVSGPSMYPFLNTDSASSTTSNEMKDTVFVSLWKPTRNLRRGHVVAFYSPLRPEVLAVKRVVGVEGDVVGVRGGAYVGQQGKEKEWGEKTKEQATVVVVPPGHVWVEGEHPEGSRWSIDSNTYGPVAVGLLVGRVEAVVLPWVRRGWVRWQDWRGNGRVRVGDKVEVEVYGID